MNKFTLNGKEYSYVDKFKAIFDMCTPKDYPTLVHNSVEEIYPGSLRAYMDEVSAPEAVVHWSRVIKYNFTYIHDIIDVLVRSELKGLISLFLYGIKDQPMIAAHVFTILSNAVSNVDNFLDIDSNTAYLNTVLIGYDFIDIPLIYMDEYKNVGEDRKDIKICLALSRSLYKDAVMSYDIGYDTGLDLFQVFNVLYKNPVFNMLPIEEELDIILSMIDIDSVVASIDDSDPVMSPLYHMIAYKARKDKYRLVNLIITVEKIQEYYQATLGDDIESITTIEGILGSIIIELSNEFTAKPETVRDIIRGMTNNLFSSSVCGMLVAGVRNVGYSIAGSTIDTLVSMDSKIYDEVDTEALIVWILDSLRDIDEQGEVRSIYRFTTDYIGVVIPIYNFVIDHYADRFTVIPDTILPMLIPMTMRQLDVLYTDKVKLLDEVVVGTYTTLLELDAMPEIPIREKEDNNYTPDID